MSNQLSLPTLLIVSDNPSVCFWVRKHLEEQFFVVEASNERTAAEALKNIDLELLIVDGHIDGVDVLDLCKTLRKLTKNSLTPLLLITGRLKKSFRDRALESGITDFLSDALDLEELETRIATGRKAAASLQKVEEVSSALQAPQRELSIDYLKKKFLLNDHALRMLASAQIEKKPLALLFLRIDGFPELLERHGFLITDELLLSLSHFVNGCCRNSDLLIPSAEGAFILLLPNTSLKEAQVIAESLSKKIKSHPLTIDKVSFSLSVSIAFSSLDATVDALNRMIHAAIKILKQMATTTNLLIPLHLEFL